MAEWRTPKVSTIPSIFICQAAILYTGLYYYIIMNNFLELNKHKFSFGLKLLSLSFTVLFVVIPIAVSIANGTYPTWTLFICVLLFGSVIFPLFLTGIVYLTWLNKIWVKKKALNRRPFDELDRIGFATAYINEKSKWNYTEEIKEIVIDGYRIQFNVIMGFPSNIEFRALVKYPTVERERFTAFEASFKEDRIYLDIDSLVKVYSPKKEDNLTIEQLKAELIQFAQMMRLENFEPLDRK